MFQMRRPIQSASIRFLLAVAVFPSLSSLDEDLDSKSWKILSMKDVGTYSKPTQSSELLQVLKKAIDTTPHLSQQARQGQVAVGIIDFSRPNQPEFASIAENQHFESASLGKIAIMTANFEAAKFLTGDPRKDILSRFTTDQIASVRYSSNSSSTFLYGLLGGDWILSTLKKYGLWDFQTGGIFTGAGYGQSKEIEDSIRDARSWNPSASLKSINNPFGFNHSVTVAKLLRWILLIEKGELVDPEAARLMKKIMWGSSVSQWANGFYRADNSTNVSGKVGYVPGWMGEVSWVDRPGLHYGIILLTRHKIQGPKSGFEHQGEVLEDFAERLHDQMLTLRNNEIQSSNDFRKNFETNFSLLEKGDFSETALELDWSSWNSLVTSDSGVRSCRESYRASRFFSSACSKLQSKLINYIESTDQLIQSTRKRIKKSESALKAAVKLHPYRNKLEQPVINYFQVINKLTDQLDFKDRVLETCKKEATTSSRKIYALCLVDEVSKYLSRESPAKALAKVRYDLQIELKPWVEF